MKEKATLPASADDLDEVPPLSDAYFARAVHRVGMKPVTKKAKINIMLDVSIIEHFKALAGARGYQTLINDTLREAVRGKEIADIIRQAIREELHTA